MVAQIDYNNGSVSVEVPKDESGFYKAIAEVITKLDYPNTATVTIAGRTIDYQLEERGGTCNVQETHNGIVFKEPGTYPKVYLTYADFESAEKKAKEARGELKLGGDYGSYKFYSLEGENGQIKASWGSMRGIGREKSCYYKNSMYWIKYYEKINKGYVDNSDAYVEKESAPAVKIPGIRLPEKTSVVNALSQKLYNLLSNSSIQLIKRSVKVMHVTQGMVTDSKKYLNQLYETKNLEEFNKILLKLCMVCPRRVWDMKDLMAKDKKDIVKVLEREEDLVTAMEGLLLKQQTISTEDTTEKSNTNPDPFKELGVEVSEASNEDIKKVYSMLPDNLKQKVSTVYKIKCEAHAKRFEEYCNKNGITQTKYLWHGSRNENWLSIIKLGLLLKPNAQITGKMFGNGIYFAPKAQKSWGYTSGGYWTGESLKGFAMMGVYETAYGNPYHPTPSENWKFTQSFLKSHNKNCVHAEGGTCNLRNDEIIFYDEGAMCLRYVVEFSN